MPKLMNEQRTKAEQSGASRADRDGARRQNAEHRALFVHWRRTGDRSALDRLVEHFTPLARGLARRYNHTSEPYEDLCQVAQLRPIEAIQRFEPERGSPFPAFAIPTILGELRRYFRNSSWAVHVPRGLQEHALEVRDTERALSEKYGRSPTVSELAQLQRCLGELRKLAGATTAEPG